MTTKISHQNNDITLKAMAEHFKDKTLEVFGLKTARIKGLMPTALPVVEAKENRTDVIFLLEDDTLLHLEFQTTRSSKEDLKRFMYYDARIASSQEHLINTAIIYSGKIEQAPDTLVCGSINFQVTNVYMKSYDGDKEYEAIRNKIENKEQLEETDYLKLIFLPLMKSRHSEEEQALKVAELAKSKCVPEKAGNFIIAAIVVITDKFMSEANKKRLLEVLSMTQIEQWIREEGRAEGKIEGKIEIALLAIKKGLSVDDITDITGLDKSTILELKKRKN
jgi:predicted transposase/invertase (TIGR01784 family)